VTGPDEVDRPDGAPVGPAAGWGQASPRPPGYGPAPGTPVAYGPPGGPSAPPPGYGPGQPGAPGYGAPQYGQPEYGQPQYGAPPTRGYGGPVPPGGYRPPPVQRGIIPLRPLSLGELLDGAFKSVRANPRVMFGLSAVVVLSASLFGIVTQVALLPSIARSVGGVIGDVDPTDELGLVDSTAASLALFGTLPWHFLAVTVLTGLLTGSVSRSVIGQKVSAGELWTRYWRRCLLLVAFSVVVQLVLLLPWLLLGLGAYLLGTAGAVGATITFGIVGAIAIVVGSVWFFVRVLLVPPTLVLENGGINASLRRGWVLSRGSFWRLLGIYLLAVIIIGLVAQVIAVPATIAAMLISPDPTSVTYIVLTTFATGLSQAISTVFVAAIVALLYIDIRIRREGLDVALARAADAAALQGTDGTGTAAR
jgi:hypothetical protein